MPRIKPRAAGFSMNPKPLSHVERAFSTSSHSNSEVNEHLGSIVLVWETAWDLLVLLALFRKLMLF